MARSAQTRSPPRPVLRVKHFKDHAGVPALRVRLARPGPFGDIADDFRSNPVFAFQVYTLIPLKPEERSALPPPHHLAHAQDSHAHTNLLALVDFLMPVNSERAPPVFEIYPDAQPDDFACIAHQKREIAHRKRNADRPDNLLIPKFQLDWSSSLRISTGFCIVITSERFRHHTSHVYDAEYGGPGLLWARFRRGESPWHLETSIARLLQSSVQNGERSADFQLLYDQSFTRMDIDCFAESDPSEVVGPLEAYCDVGIGEDEETDQASSEPLSDARIEQLAQRLSLSPFSLTVVDENILRISNHKPEAEPDLRYVIYVPFLPPLDKASLEQVAKAFASSVTSLIANSKTVSFEFRRPSTPSRASMLADYRTSGTDPIGALLDLEETSDSPAFKGRLHCNGPSRWGIVNEQEDQTYYRTMLIILWSPDIQAKGSVEYLFSDAVPGPYDEMIYQETMSWFSGGIEEMANRLEMNFMV